MRCLIHTLLLGMFLLTGGCGDDPPPAAPGPAATAGLPQPTATEPSSTESDIPNPGAVGSRSAEPVPAPVVAATPPQPEPSPDAIEVAADREPVQHQIQGVVTQWRPLVLFAQPGDVVVFRQMSGHDTETMAGLYPEGATPWRSKMGAEGFSVTLTEPGAYIYKCNPHASTGMIGAIVVGPRPPANLAALESSPLNKGMTARTIRKLKQALESASN